MKHFYITHQGRSKEHNEDRLLVKELAGGSLLMAVADGLGGHAAGELAAQIAIEVLDSYFPVQQSTESNLIELVLESKRRIIAESKRNGDFQGMGTTLTCVYIAGGTAYWVHVGDSRLYLLREGALVQVTDDHTIPGLLLASGEITRDEAFAHPMRNVLTSFIGPGEIEVDAGSLELTKGDLLIISTDGVHDVIGDQTLESLLLKDAALEERLKSVVHSSIAAGSTDDMTAVAAEV
jgi:serine/threonine protein phosphatase PrpC